MNMAEKTEVEEVPKGYKKTEIGILPEDWRVVRLGDLGKIITGSTPSKKIEDFWKNGDIEFIKPPDLNDSEIKTYSELVSRHAKNLRIVPKGSVLVSCIGKIGKTGFAIKEVAFNQQINAIVPNKAIIDSKFLFFSIQTQKEQLISLQSNTIMPIINKSKFSMLLIPLPPLQEQKKIAKILDKIRQAIELQDKEIETWKKMKKAVMAKVFREGLHGEELKDTEIGKVPRSWEVVRLGKVCHVVMGQSPPSSTYNFRGEGFPFFQGKAEFGDIYPKIEKYTTHPLKMAKKGDILISVRAPVGDVNLAPTICAIGRGLAAITPKKEIYAIYLFYLLKFYKNRIEARGTGSTFKTIRKSNLENLLISLPPIQEQKEIAHVLSTIDKKIEIEKRRKEILEKLFKTMLQLLMTGKLRVKEVEI